MSIELTTKNIGVKKMICNTFAEQSIDSDINLPDYCPDIMRILKCTVCSDITNSKIVGDRAVADGNAKIRIIYSDEKNNIFCYDADYPFSKYAELPTPADNAVLSCSAKTDYVNCRAVSKRRLDIHGVISLRFDVSTAGEISVISSACGDGIQLKRKSFDLSSMTVLTAKSFQVAEVKETGSSNPGIGKIISAQASPILMDTKIIKGKMLIKGELCVKAIYCSDEKSNETAELNCNIPFNEIIEAAEFNDTCSAAAELTVMSLTAEPKVDNDGEYRYMNINAEVCAKVTAHEASDITVIADAYSTLTQIDTKYNLIKMPKLAQNFTDTCLCRQSIDISSLDADKIFACITSEPEYKCTFSDGKMSVKGKIPLCIIMISKDGSPVSCEREAEFEYLRNIDGNAETLSCNCKICITGYGCSISADGSVDFKAELNICSAIFNNYEEKVLTALSASENGIKKNKKSSLTIYFCSGKESLWDIARRYNTTVEDIMEENELSADYPENKTMLMIPIK